MMVGSIIHPTTIIEPGAEIGAGVQIGPFCHIGARVKIGEHSKLHSRVTIMNHVRIGAHAEIYPGTVLGAPPQDTKYKGEDTALEIGDHCLMRENVTMHIASVGGSGVTRVGNHCSFFVNAHVAHDCTLGDHVTMINNTVLGGHVRLEDYVTIGGNSAVHQHVRVGFGAMLGGMSGLRGDLIPYGIAHGDLAMLEGLNWVGLERRGFTSAQVREMRRFYRDLFLQDGVFAERLATAREKYAANDLIKPILDFMATPSHRELCRPVK